MILTANNSYSGGTTIFGGTLTVNSESGNATGTGAVSVNSGGTLAGTGFIAGAVTINSGGTLTPGTSDQSAGTTTITNSYTQVAGGKLEIEIGGTTPGSQHDLVGVSGNVFLGGQLQLGLIDGFIPMPSQTFTVLNSTNIFGVFSNVFTGQRLETLGGLGSFQVNYGAGSAFEDSQIVLSDFLSAGILGDFDFDNDVDGRDFLVWQRGGSTNPVSAGDLADWQANYGTNSLAAATTVPEPGMVCLWAIACVLLNRRDIRRNA
jgi:autotransporter-associated beta strand protein